MPFYTNVVCLVAAAAAVISACSRGGASQDPPGSGRTAGEVVTPVAAVTAARRDLARQVTLSGPVEPIRIIGVNSRMAGTILAVRVVEGDRLQPGQLMAELDPRETAAQLERARAVLASTQSAFDRAEQMRTAAIITEEEFEQSRANYQIAKSDVELWETRLAFSRVLAPAKGVVVEKFVEAGSAVSVNQRLFDVADVSLLVVRVRMSELDVVHVQPGDSVRVQLDAYPGRLLLGEVLRIFPSADPQTRLVPVEVGLVDRRALEVRPGFLARVQFPLERRPGVVAVPAAAVGTGAQGRYVYVIDADTLIRRPITTGLNADGLIEVMSGLAGGESVVVSGQVNLRPGVQVRVTVGAPDSGETSAQVGQGEMSP